MLARAFGNSVTDGWTVDMSRYQAYEIFGPGVGVWVQISNVATVAGLAVLVALWIRAYRNSAVSPTAVGLIVLATVAIMTITNNTLSPQYLLWLGGPMAALLVLRRGVRLQAVVLPGRVEGRHDGATDGLPRAIGRRWAVGGAGLLDRGL